MSLRGLARQAREIAEVPRDLALGRYPAFVSGGDLPRGHVPVFVLHGVQPAGFARQLDHLERNGYATLSADELVEVIRERRPAPERGVALTFDDGRGSVWSVAAPLLRQRGMRATVFLVPARVRDGVPPGPSWDDVESGRSPEAEVLAREENGGAFVHWSEVESLAREGLLEFESHTLSHACVHAGPRLADFLSPALRRGAGVMDVPWIRDGERELLAHEIPLGTPLLVSEPRTSEALRFLETAEFREAAVNLVAAGGGAAFFEQPRWRQRLQETVTGGVPGHWESPAEREHSIRAELAEARTVIERRTGRPTRHLCYPWHAAGPTARRLAGEVGYESAFCGKVYGTPITLAGGDALSIARVGEDFLELLPGQGRSRLASVLARKWRRRFRRGA